MNRPSDNRAVLLPSLILVLAFTLALPARAGVLVIAYMDEAKVALVNGKTYETLAVLDTGKNPHEVRISPDRRSAYVAAGKTITAIDLKKKKVRANFDLGEFSAHDIRVSRDNRRLWLACARQQSILELDAETGKVLNTFATKQEGSWFVEVTPDERKLYTPNLEGKSVSVITRATGETKIISFDHAVYGIDITRDGKHIWVSGRNLNIIDTATDKVVHTIATPDPDTGRIRLTSDAKTAVIALLDKVVVYDVRTRRLITETKLNKNPKVLTVSGTGRYAFLTNPTEDSVSVVDIISGKLQRHFATGKKPDGIAWAD